ncbi:MAG: hypothetical protein ACRD4F_14685 [Candidatus Angelobacter sp.]
MSNNVFEDYRNFSGITEAWELARTGLIVIKEELYKLELWRSHSNPDIPFYVAIHIQEKGIWKRISDPPFANGCNGDEALRDAMVFLSERLAA